jgi:hypothetical protein
MNITETVSYDKDGRIVPKTQFIPWRKLFLSLVIILVGALGFGIGRLTSLGQGSAMKIEYDPSLSALMNTSITTSPQTASAIQSLPNNKVAPILLSENEVVGSSKGTKYHYSHCSGAKQISEANKVTFPSPAAAEASGYILAANCRPK